MKNSHSDFHYKIHKISTIHRVCWIVFNKNRTHQNRSLWKLAHHTNSKRICFWEQKIQWNWTSAQNETKTGNLLGVAKMEVQMYTASKNLLQLASVLSKTTHNPCGVDGEQGRTLKLGDILSFVLGTWYAKFKIISN